MAFNPDKFLAETNSTNRVPAQGASSGFNPDKFLEETAQYSQPEQQLPEADLGFVTRAKYALEPLQTNKEALLREKFGAENVVNKNGELYINQNGYLRPVNEKGYSTADTAEILGALPETVPTYIGTVLGATGGTVGGAAAGAPAAGIGSIPGGVAGFIAGTSAGRAIGGGLGSAFRQALSAATGTPQEAGIRERAGNVALSAASSVVGGKVADVASPYLGKIPVLGKLFGGAPGAAAEQAASKAPQAIEQSISAELNPIASDAIESVSYPREVVNQQMQKLKDIAARQGLPDPTYAQAAGGKAILAEGKLIDTPLVGGKVRAQVDSQLKAVKKNLEKIAGTFIDAESSAYEVGLATKELASTNQEVQKKVAQELYQKVDELGANASIGKKVFFNKYRDFAGELGLINPDLSPAKYAADTGLTRNEFDVIQSALFDGMGAISKTKSPTIRFDSVNALRKTLNATAEELSDKNPNAARILQKFVNDINDTAERTLSREAPKLGEVFKEANKNYAIYKDIQEFNKKIFSDGMGEEKVVKKLMSDSAKIEKMKSIIGEDRVKEVGVSYVKDILEPLSKSGVARADSALSAIKKNSAQIKAAIGEADYTALVENLYYLNRTNQPLNISRASLYSLLDETKGGLKGFALRVAGSAKTYSEATGKSLSDPIKTATAPISNAVDATLGRGLTRGTSANVIGAPLKQDIQMTKSGDKFIRTGNNDKKENYRSPSQKFTRSNQ